MRTTRAVVLTLAVLLVCGGCGQTDVSHQTQVQPPDQITSGPTSVLPTTSPATAAAAGAASSPFCVQARQIADRERLSPGRANVPALLAGVDRLDALAPRELAADVHVFRRVEHAVLEPDSRTPPPPAAQTGRALRDVAAYFHDVCHATYDG